jgi:hypothetical protein
MHPKSYYGTQAKGESHYAHFSTNSIGGFRLRLHHLLFYGSDDQRINVYHQKSYQELKIVS